ncbi:MAG: hypothetical protein PHV74_05675 [Dehalococcoidia bacterium]|nr:hypothetical protein [Dehalococcoidia bacterium]
MRKILGLMAVVMLVALMVASTGIASADQGSQKWNLDSQIDVSGNPLMERASGPGDDGQTGSVTVLPGLNNCVYFIADEFAVPLSGVTFAASNTCGWLASFTLGGVGGAQYVVADVGLLDQNGANFQSFGAMTNIVIPNNWSVQVMFSMPGQTVPQNMHLALRVYNNDQTATPMNIQIMTGNDKDGCSYLISPCTDPGYPTPEIATALLVGLGVLGLGGYVFIRRRQVTTTVGV